MNSTKELIDHHLDCFGAGDLEGIMSDYTDESVLFTQHGSLRGCAPIRGLMSSLFAEFAKPGARFALQTQVCAGDVGFIVWSAETPDNRYELGTDTFVVRGGKIACQTFAGKIVPRV